MNELFKSVPEVTVLMSCFNGARWLSGSISSILNQTFSNFEFVIVDDGSTDNSSEIIAAFAKLDPRIVVLTKPNTGLADSLNTGMHIARGIWIARIDADDISYPSRIEKQLSLARRKPDFTFIGSGMVRITEDGSPIKTYLYPERHSTLLRNLRSSRKFPPHSSAFFRLDAAHSVGGYRIRIIKSQDEDLWLRLSEVGDLTSIREPLVSIRQHSNQISHGDSGEKQRVFSRVAITSHWLRIYGLPDPVSLDDNFFEVFRSWVEANLKKEFIRDYYEYTERIKNYILDIKNDPVKLIHFAVYIICSPLLFLRLLSMKIFGDTSPKRLVKNWINRV